MLVACGGGGVLAACGGGGVLVTHEGGGVEAWGTRAALGGRGASTRAGKMGGGRE